MQKVVEKETSVAVVGIIFDERGRVLLSKRNEKENMHDHNHWQLPGGGIEFGEHPIDTLNREIAEELGIVIDLLHDQPFVSSQTYNTHGVHTILLAYPATHKNGEIDVSKDPHVSEAKFFTDSEIDHILVSPGTKEEIKKARTFLIQQYYGHKNT